MAYFHGSSPPQYERERIVHLEWPVLVQLIPTHRHLDVSAMHCTRWCDCALPFPPLFQKHRQGRQRGVVGARNGCPSAHVWRDSNISSWQVPCSLRLALSNKSRRCRLPSKDQLELSCLLPTFTACRSHLFLQDVFRPYGLREGVIKPTYGLAEHTVFVCSGGEQRLRVSKDALEGDKQARHEEAEIFLLES